MTLRSYYCRDNGQNKIGHWRPPRDEATSERRPAPRVTAARPADGARSPSEIWSRGANELGGMGTRPASIPKLG